MPRSVVTAGPLCNESEFAKRIARLLKKTDFQTLP